MLNNFFRQAMICKHVRNRILLPLEVGIPLCFVLIAILH
jgi:hypothetical protein